MDVRPPPPALSPQASFIGGIRNSWGFGGTAPFGHLEFDRRTLAIFGLGMRLEVERENVQVVTLSTGVLAVRVTVVGLDGEEMHPYFAALDRDAVRTELEVRGWPVHDFYLLKRSRQ